MYDVFGALKSFIKVDEINIDNNVFRLHYKVTVLFLLGCCLVATARTYIGNPIQCLTASKDDMSMDVINTYCWIHSTFTLPAAFSKKVGVEVLFPGIDKANPGEDRTYHKYYQWVCFALFFQALLFYVPRYLWRAYENGKIKSLILGFNAPIILDPKKMADDRNVLSTYLKDTLNKHDMYAYVFFFCEVLNFLNVIFQIYFMDYFLGGEFSSYGMQVMAFSEMDQENRTDPMIRVFPRITKCTFRRFGPSGDIQSHDVLCVLPLNIVNEKIYVFLWFWFMLLALISFVVIIYRIMLIYSPGMRLRIMRASNRFVKSQDTYYVAEETSIGDWMVLMLLGKNIDPLHFREIVREFDIKLDPKNRDMQSQIPLLSEQKA